MAKLILASVLCIFLLVKGTEAAEVVTGASCATVTNTCKDTDYCENDVCKIKEQGECDSTSKTPNCIDNAECPAAGNTEGKTPDKCTCNNEHTANGDQTVCGLKIGETCTGSVPCVTGSECPKEGTTKGKCTCSGGATPSEDKTKCGAMGIAASMLLVVATFVTSRFV